MTHVRKYTTYLSFTFDDFHRSLSGSKSRQISRTHLSILADLNSAVVRTISISPLISSSLRYFLRFLGIIPRALTTIGITVIFMFYYIF